MVDQYLSRKIRILSLVALLCVAYIHAYDFTNVFLQPTTFIAEGFSLPAMFEFFLSNALMRFAVPLFFAISGYMYFINFEMKWHVYLDKLLKRVRTLAVPYIIWTLLATALMAFAYKVVGVEEAGLIEEKLLPLLNGDVIAWFLAPPCFQFWFIKDLFIIVVFAPVVYWLVKKLKLIVLAAFFIPWLFDCSWFISCDNLLFFTVGAYVALHSVKLTGMTEDNKVGKRGDLLLAPWVLTAAVYTVLSAYGSTHNVSTLLMTVLYKTITALGLLSVWRLYDVWEKKLNNKAVMLAASNSFIMFAGHEPLQQLTRIYILQHYDSDLIRILIYLFLPLLVCAGLVLLGILLRKKCPAVHRVLSGSR